jgi:DNA invertase Pin-like site-specific DNA recombinase
MRMLQDAKEKKIDLIITREVSRFARNTVDTLQQPRTLKTYGVEVWFTEDNIWIMNDEDGELRLSIMVTLAQNESKKISQRVKAGQMISFKNGVLYGNGNILGYDRVGDKLVVNKE